MNTTPRTQAPRCMPTPVGDLVVLALMMFGSAAALAGDGSALRDYSSPEIGDAEQIGEKAIEEIVVREPRPIFRIRAEIRRTDEEMFAVFNSLNDDSDYDVRCKWETTHISRLKRHVCKPSYKRQIDTNNWHNMGDQIILGPTVRITPGELRRRDRIFRGKMLSMAEENPDLAELVFKRARLEIEHRKELARKNKRRSPDAE